MNGYLFTLKQVAVYLYLSVRPRWRENTLNGCLAPPGWET